MRKLSFFLALILTVSAVGIGASAQKGSNNNRPPKEDNRVKERDKERPPQNSNQGNSGNSNKRRP